MVFLVLVWIPNFFYFHFLMENIDRKKNHSEFYPWKQNLWIETTNPTYQIKTAEVWDHKMLPDEPKARGQQLIFN